MRPGLAKADARIDHDITRPHPGLQAILGPPLQKAPDLADHIGIFRLVLHGLGRAPHVVDDITTSPLRAERDYAGVIITARDIIDDAGAGIQRGLGHPGTAGVNADGDLLRLYFSELFNDRQHPPDLRFFTDPRRAGPSGLTADIDNIGALVDHPPAMPDGGLRLFKPAAIGKTVRRDV